MRDKSLYHSQHSKQHEHHVSVGSCAPQILRGEQFEGAQVEIVHTEFASRLRNPELGESASFIASLLFALDRDITSSLKIVH